MARPGRKPPPAPADIPASTASSKHAALPKQKRTPSAARKSPPAVTITKALREHFGQSDPVAWDPSSSPRSVNDSPQEDDSFLPDSPPRPESPPKEAPPKETPAEEHPQPRQQEDPSSPTTIPRKSRWPSFDPDRPVIPEDTATPASILGPHARHRECLIRYLHLQPFHKTLFKISFRTIPYHCPYQKFLAQDKAKAFKFARETYCKPLPFTITQSGTDADRVRLLHDVTSELRKIFSSQSGNPFGIILHVIDAQTGEEFSVLDHPFRLSVYEASELALQRIMRNVPVFSPDYRGIFPSSPMDWDLSTPILEPFNELFASSSLATLLRDTLRDDLKQHLDRQLRDANHHYGLTLDGLLLFTWIVHQLFSSYDRYMNAIFIMSQSLQLIDNNWSDYIDRVDLVTQLLPDRGASITFQVRDLLRRHPSEIFRHPFQEDHLNLIHGRAPQLTMSDLVRLARAAFMHEPATRQPSVPPIQDVPNSQWSSGPTDSSSWGTPPTNATTDHDQILTLLANAGEHAAQFAQSILDGKPLAYPATMGPRPPRGPAPSQKRRKQPSWLTDRPSDLNESRSFYDGVKTEYWKWCDRCRKWSTNLSKYHASEEMCTQHREKQQRSRSSDVRGQSNRPPAKRQRQSGDRQTTPQSSNNRSAVNDSNLRAAIAAYNLKIGGGSGQH